MFAEGGQIEEAIALGLVSLVTVGLSFYIVSYKEKDQ